MPFSLCNAPSVFQRQMNKMLGHLFFVVVCLDYLDDILVFSQDEEKHERHLKTVLSLLKEAKFYAKLAKLSKCHCFQASTKFFGYCRL